MRTVKFFVIGIAAIGVLTACNGGVFKSRHKAETFGDSARLSLGMVMNNVKEMPDEGSYEVIIDNDSTCVFTFLKEGNTIATEYYYMKIRNKKTGVVKLCECINKPTGERGSMISIHDILNKHRGRLRFYINEPKYKGMSEQQVLESLAYMDMCIGCALYGNVIEEEPKP